MAQALKKEDTFDLISDFRGYRHKEDQTNLGAGYLVSGSQNVLTTTGGDKVKQRDGYTLDGQADSTQAPILSSFDFWSHLGFERNIRVANLKMQVRYRGNAGDVFNGHTFTQDEVRWLDFYIPSSNNCSFVKFWDATNLRTLLLFVDKTSYIKEWSGAITTLASATTDTITKNGTSTWAESGFLASGTRKVLINGTEYTYTGGETTTTLTGVTGDPSSEPANSIIIQTVRLTANPGGTNQLPTTLRNDIIGIRKNQIYIGSELSQSLYVSKVSSFTDFNFSSPRIAAEGAYALLDAPPVSFINQEDAMYVSAGKDFWYKTSFQVSSDNTKELFNVEPLKTSPLQGAQSDSLVGKIKNSVIFINNEPTLDELGRVTGVIATPQSVNVSDPIKLDFDSYDFTNGHIKYYKNFIYISVPVEGKVLIYNMAKNYWEAPQIMPISRFAIIEGKLYGHSYRTPETFKLFDGDSDNGNPIDAKAIFSYMNYGYRAEKKWFDEFFYEGYIKANTKLTVGIKYEIDGCAKILEYPIDGSNSQVVCITSTDASIGKESLGKNPLGSSTQAVSNLPKMRGIKTLVRYPFYEVQFSFSSYGKDFAWEILSFGPKVSLSGSVNHEIKE